MKKYKFRCWYRNKMRYDITGFEFYGEGNLSGVFIDGEFADEIELMQYTGLHDKNGKEIYEGDIVKINAHSYDFGFEKDRIGEIRFIEGCFGFYKQLSEKEYLFNELSTEFGYGELEYYEVIGNIYENSNLLKGADNIE